LLVLGVEWFWRRYGKRQRRAALALAAVLAAYSLMAIKLMWLPPI
jgi:hypothetical protein